jgi:hypothetical protein
MADADPTIYARSLSDLDEQGRKAKLQICPHCRRSGTLNGHGFLRGYGEDGTPQVLRGRRLFCSNRRRRPGCGRTFAVLHATVIARFMVTTATLLAFVDAVLAGAPRAAAWPRVTTAFCLRTGYRLWRRLAQGQAPLRASLSLRCAPPDCTSRHPLGALRAHLASALPDSPDVFAGFQRALQRGLFA